MQNDWYKMILSFISKICKNNNNTHTPRKKKLSIKSSLEKVTFLMKSMFCLTKQYTGIQLNMLAVKCDRLPLSFTYFQIIYLINYHREI